MTTLYIRLPARADSHPDGHGACQYALAGDGGALLQQGAGIVGAIADMVAQAHRVVLLVAAPDVTLVRVKAPPLSEARLKAALPALVEDQILGDPADCVLAAAPATPGDGLRTIAVVQRAVLAPQVKALLTLGARRVAAVPAQLCLPLQDGAVSVALGVGDLTLRLGQYEGSGVVLDAHIDSVLPMARALAGALPFTLYVPSAQLEQYQSACAKREPEVRVEADHWHHWIAGAASAKLDLASALGAVGAQTRNWQRWRWPLRIAALAALVNIAAINVEWLRLKREADSVRLAILQTFKAAYPNQTVILDPLAQMRQQVAAARVDSGQLGVDEFIYVSAALGEALRAQGEKPLIAGLEYREQTLTVKLKPEGADPVLPERVRGALSARALSLEVTATNTWQIHATKGKP